MQAAVVRLLQCRLHFSQASELSQQCPPAAGQAGAGNDRLGSRCSNPAAIFSSSQFLGGAAVRKVWSTSRDTESCSSLGRAGGRKVVCLAKEKRVKMVSQQIKREISDMLSYDKVVQAALFPETALGADKFLTAVATISDVEMSKDLSVAKVYISIYGDDRGREEALEALKNKAAYVRKGLAQRMNLKNTPEIRFIKDEALERGSRVIGILDKLKKERQQKEGSGLIVDEKELGGDQEEEQLPLDDEEEDFGVGDLGDHESEKC